MAALRNQTLSFMADLAMSIESGIHGYMSALARVRQCSDLSFREKRHGTDDQGQNTDRYAEDRKQYAHRCSNH